MNRKVHNPQNHEYFTELTVNDGSVFLIVRRIIRPKSTVQIPHT